MSSTFVKPKHPVEMKKLFGLLVIVILALTGCNNQETKTQIDEASRKETNPPDEFTRLNEFMRKFEESSGIFRSQSENRIKVICRQGTIIHINPSDLETEDGQPAGKNIVIEVKELFNQQQLIRANIQTVSDGRLLVSGGAVYINPTSDGQRLKLKEGKTFSLELPRQSVEEMALYYGQPDSTNKMNWKQSGETFELPGPGFDTPAGYEAVIITGEGRFSDTSRVTMKDLSKEQIESLKKETEMADKVYSPIELNKFGWINCDRLFKPEAPRTNVQFTITNNAEEVNYAKVCLVFKDINSVMQSSYYVWENKVEKADFSNVPVGTTVKFLAACYQHGKIFASLTDELKVSDNQHEKLTLYEMNEADFDSLLKRIE